MLLLLKSDQDGIERTTHQAALSDILVLKSDQDGIESRIVYRHNRRIPLLKSDQDGIESLDNDFIYEIPCLPS